MAARKTSLKSRLARRREIEITVTGRTSGRAISIPVWFVLEDETLYLLPAYGSDTQWYQNLRKTPSLRIRAGNTTARCEATRVTNAKQVSSVVERFRAKYGDSGVDLYTKPNVAVIAHLA